MRRRHMDTIPETRMLGKQNDIAVPPDLMERFDDPSGFEVERDGSDIVLTPTTAAQGRTVVNGNHIRLLESQVEGIEYGTIFAVIPRDGCVVYRPEDDIEIRL